MQSINSDEQLKSALAALPADMLEKMAAQVQRLEAGRDQYPLAHVVPHRVQEAFLRLDKRKKFFFGANSAGKSFIGCYEVACYLVGEDPLGIIPFAVPKPKRKIFGIPSYTKIWLGCVKLDKGVEILRQNLIPLLPPGFVLSFNETRGLLKVKSGAQLQIMSYDQEIEKWQSDAVDFIMYDEQPPFRHYQEGLARLARRDGRCICTVTPLYTNSTWMFWEVIRNINKKKDVGYVTADLEDNIYLTQSMKDTLYEDYKGTKEESARLHGMFLNLLGAVHAGFDKNVHVVEPFEITKEMKEKYKFVRIFDLHPKAPYACSFFMIGRQPPEIWLIGEMTVQHEYVGDFAKMVHRKTKEMDIKVFLNIIDSPDPVDPAHQGGSLALDLAAAGIAGIKGNRDVPLGIKRFDKYLMEKKIHIFNTCEDHIFSIENYKWDFHRGKAADYLEEKQKPISKDDHHVRNIHYLLCWMPSLDENAEMRENFRRNGKYRSTARKLNHGAA